MQLSTARPLVKLLLALCSALATATAALGAYVYRTHARTRSLQAQLAQRIDLQRELAKQLPSDQCLFPHFKNEVGYVFHPLIGQATLWGPKGHPYFVNSLGLRGPAIDPPGPGRRRIVLVGDSWYFGWRLEEQERLEGHLQRLLKDVPYDVVTVAIPGWNVRSEASFIKSIMRILDPSVIIWEVCPNDIWDTGGIIPPATLSWEFSPQSRDPEDNAFNAIIYPLHVMPAMLARHEENLVLIDDVRRKFGVPVLAASVDLPPALWSFLARQAGVDLPVIFTPHEYSLDRRGRISDDDNHPTSWMNERLAVGYAARLVEIGLLPPISLTPDQKEVASEWRAVNATPAGPRDLDRYVQSVVDTMPESYTSEADFDRIAAGYKQEGRMGRHGIVQLRVPAGRSAITVAFEALPYASRYQRQVQMTVRNFENRETVTTRGFSAERQPLSCSLPLPPGGSRYPVYEVEWRFNYDECDHPNRCFAARLLSVSSR